MVAIPLAGGAAIFVVDSSRGLQQCLQCVFVATGKPPQGTHNRRHLYNCTGGFILVAQDCTSIGSSTASVTDSSGMAKVGQGKKDTSSTERTSASDSRGQLGIRCLFEANANAAGTACNCKSRYSLGGPNALGHTAPCQLCEMLSACCGVRLPVPTEKPAGDA